MAKPTRPLTGFAKDAWLRRQVSAGGDTEDIVSRLQSGIASLKVREADGIDAPGGTAPEPSSDDPVAVPAFDPYTPNVVVVIRTQGAEAARAALAAIPSADNLRHLAREQRLTIEDGIAGHAEIVAAIIAAAERRIANRRAAAS